MTADVSTADRPFELGVFTFGEATAFRPTC